MIERAQSSFRLNPSIEWTKCSVSLGPPNTSNSVRNRVSYAGYWHDTVFSCMSVASDC
ncbi:hypothetical protein GCM10010436_95780 [Paractinoplanes durhamensis]